MIELPDTLDVISIAENLEQSPLLKASEPNMVIRADYDPDDIYFLDGHQLALYNTGQDPPSGTFDADIDAPESWDISMGGSAIIFAILDSGIPLDGNGNLSHPDLDDPAKFIVGEDFIDVPADGSEQKMIIENSKSPDLYVK